MKAFFFTFSFLFIASIVAFAQDTTKADTTPPPPPVYWTQKGSVSLNLTTVGLNNWAGGGENSFSIASLFSEQVQYKKDKVTWLNTLEAGYGMVRQGTDAKFIKSDDRLIVISKFARDIGHKKIAYSGLLDFRTQMTPGYKYAEDANGEIVKSLISDLLGPAYLTVSAGGEYKPSDNFYLMAAPVSGKITFVMNSLLNSQGAYGVDTGKTIRPELGSVMSLRWHVEPMKNVVYETKLNMFQAYKKGAFVDVMWDNILILKVNGYITSNITTNLIYDEDVSILKSDGTSGKAVQFKYVLNVGITLKF